MSRDEWVQPTIEGGDPVPLADLNNEEAPEPVPLIDHMDWEALFDDDTPLACGIENPDECESCT